MCYLNIWKTAHLDTAKPFSFETSPLRLSHADWNMSYVYLYLDIRCIPPWQKRKPEPMSGPLSGGLRSVTNEKSSIRLAFFAFSTDFLPGPSTPFSPVTSYCKSLSQHTLLSLKMMILEPSYCIRTDKCVKAKVSTVTRASSNVPQLVLSTGESRYSLIRERPRQS